MSAKVREFVDFWIENSIHAVEQFRTPGASQDVTELSRRFIQAAQDQGFSEADLRVEIGNVNEYVAKLLAEANKAEHDRDRR